MIFKLGRAQLRIVIRDWDARARKITSTLSDLSCKLRARIIASAIVKIFFILAKGTKICVRIDNASVTVGIGAWACISLTGIGANVE